MRIGNWKQTYTGVQFYPLDPRPEEIRIEDIAHHLALQCRFTGAVSAFYSVAEHSVRVSFEVEKRALIMRGLPDEHTRLMALTGLLHDAEEFVFGDMARPIKYEPIMAGYRAASRSMRFAILARFGIPSDYWSNEDIKRVDDVLLATEKRDLMGPEPAPWIALPPPLEPRIEPWSWDTAETRFLARFVELQAK